MNILEDVRIEKMIQEKYKGSKIIFKRGYQELIKNNFFETKGEKLAPTVRKLDTDHLKLETKNS